MDALDGPTLLVSRRSSLLPTTRSSPSSLSSTTRTAPPTSPLSSLKPFKSSTPRRDCTNTIRAALSSYQVLAKCTVLEKSAHRLATRMSDVLLGVVHVLERVEVEGNGGGEKKAYEYEDRKDELTVFKIQSTIFDIQSFSTILTSQTSKDRLSFLALSIPSTFTTLAQLTASLKACITLYSLPLSTTTWTTEDASDHSIDEAALPRLFRVAFALRGPLYSRFLEEHPTPPSPPPSPSAPTNSSSPSSNPALRTAFLEYCYSLNPSLRPPEGESVIKPWFAPPSPPPPSSPVETTVTRRSSLASMVPYSYGPSSLRSRETARSASEGSSGGAWETARGGAEAVGRVGGEAESGLGIAMEAGEEEEDKEEALEVKEEVQEAEVEEPPRSSTPLEITSSSSEESAGSTEATTIPSSPEKASEEKLSGGLDDVEDDEEQEEAERGQGEMQEEGADHVITPSTSSDVPAEPPSPLNANIDVQPSTLADAPSPPLPCTSDSSEPPSPSPPPKRISHVPTLSTDIDVDADPSIFSDPQPLSNPNRSSLLAPILTFRAPTPVSRPTTPTQAPVQSEPLRVLVLDGGGIRGLPLLFTLKSALEGVKREGKEDVRPCECFDLIAGVGTGGLVAVLLGRLRLSIQDAIELYLGIASTAFLAKNRSTKSRWSKLFSSTSSENTTIRDTLLEKALTSYLPDDLMEDPKIAEDPDSSRCRTAVLAFQQGKGGAAGKWFRSYESGDEEDAAGGNLSLKEVCRATMASSPFFKPYAPTLGPGYGEGRSQNPSEAALAEVRKVWEKRDITCFLSVGVGRVSVVDGASFKGSKTKMRILRVVAGLAGDAQREAERFRTRVAKEGWEEQYIRYNVDLPLAIDEGIEEHAHPNRLARAIDEWMAASNTLTSSSPLVKGLRSEQPSQFLSPDSARYASQRSWYDDEEVEEEDKAEKPIRTSISMTELRTVYLHAEGSTSSL